MKLKRPITLLLLFTSLPLFIFCQDPLRFSSEVETINKRFVSREGSRDLILFTGSSSIRRWENMPEYFPGKNIINTGFGGSQMSDLIFFAEQVIFRYKPVQIFIYEGDNDIASGEKASGILQETDSLIRMIHKRLPMSEIVLISAKPSPLRWGLKEDYQKLNGLFSQLPAKYMYVRYIDLWTPLISPSGRPVSEYYIKDSLHINTAGYDRWALIVGKVLK